MRWGLSPIIATSSHSSKPLLKLWAFNSIHRGPLSTKVSLSLHSLMKTGLLWLIFCRSREQERPTNKTWVSKSTEKETLTLTFWRMCPKTCQQRASTTKTQSLLSTSVRISKFQTWNSIHLRKSEQLSQSRQTFTEMPRLTLLTQCKLLTPRSME
jgi:hypothetical protein